MGKIPKKMVGNFKVGIEIERELLNNFYKIHVNLENTQCLTLTQITETMHKI